MNFRAVIAVIVFRVPDSSPSDAAMPVAQMHIAFNDTEGVKDFAEPSVGFLDVLRSFVVEDKVVPELRGIARDSESELDHVVSSMRSSFLSVLNAYAVVARRNERELVSPVIVRVIHILPKHNVPPVKKVIFSALTAVAEDGVDVVDDGVSVLKSAISLM